MTDKTKEAPARSALKLALEALESAERFRPGVPIAQKAITAIREVLALVNEVDQEQPAQSTADKSKLETVPAKGGLLPAQHQCKFPLCQNEEYQQALAEQLKRELYTGEPAQPQQEPVAWRNAALRVGEDLCSVGPFGYYDMTAEQWLDWALSVVTVHAPPVSPSQGDIKPWVGLTDEEVEQGLLRSDYALQTAHAWRAGVIFAIAKLKEKNT